MDVLIWTLAFILLCIVLLLVEQRRRKRKPKVRPKHGYCPGCDVPEVRECEFGCPYIDPWNGHLY